MDIFIAFSTVATMLLYALPGFIIIKAKIVKACDIPAFARLLMYVCSPMLSINSITSIDFSAELLKNMAIAFAFLIASMCVMILASYLILKRRSSDARYRVCSLATAMGNVGFMGVPILGALLPEYPEAIAFSAMASLALNIVGWTLGSAIITRNKKYMSIKKILFNPTTVATFVAILISALDLSIPAGIGGAVSLLAKMTTPLCMLIMGMRLACSSPKNIFARPIQYAAVLVKQTLFPALCLLVMRLLSFDPNMCAALFILSACPTANVVLSFAEMLGEGQETAAGTVLLGTTASALTIPLMMLLI